MRLSHQAMVTNKTDIITKKIKTHLTKENQNPVLRIVLTKINVSP